MPDSPDQSAPPEQPQARFRPSRWPGWIWVVPAAALLIVGWLGLRDLLLKGPSVTVRFEQASAIEAGNTKVKYQGMDVGQVDSVSLEKDLRHVDVTIQFDSELQGHLGPGTRYWIGGGHISLGDLSSIRSAIAGPYVAVDPHPGHTVDKVDGLASPPVIKDSQPGRAFVLETGDIGNISRDTPVSFHSENVGEVLSYSADAEQQRFRITIFVRAPFDDLVRADTRFWSAAPIHLSITPSGPSVAFQSLPALVQGAIAFITPPDAPGPPSPEETVFNLYPDKNTAQNAAPADGVAYSVVFGDQQSNLPAGAAVQLIDTTIGSVRRSTLEYDAAAGRLNTRAIIVISPRKLHILNAKPDGARMTIDDMMRRLIGQGLRAEMTKAAPVVGGEIVRLHFVPAAGAATLGEGDPPSIPTEPGSGVDTLLAKANTIMDKVDGVPIDQIADQVQITTQKLAQLSQSQELTRSLQDLQRSMQNIQGITAETRENVRPILAEVRQAAAQAQEAVRSARAVLGSNMAGGSNNAAETAALPGTLYELSRAARSLRELADFLDQHPEALITGKRRNE